MAEAVVLVVKVVEADFQTGNTGDGLPTGFTAQWANGTGNGEMTGLETLSTFTFSDDAAGYTVSSNEFGGTGGAYSTTAATVN